jgi:hypothetical protein
MRVDAEQIHRANMRRADDVFQPNLVIATISVGEDPGSSGPGTCPAATGLGRVQDKGQQARKVLAETSARLEFAAGPCAGGQF